MSPRTAVAAAARAAGTLHAPTRTRPRTRPAAPSRRRSGATARPRPSARPRTAARPAARPRVEVLPAVDRILRGPAYIALVFVLLAGIVFFNVGVLQLNHGIAGTDKRASELKRENALLTLQVAKLGSSERIQGVALQAGLVLPQPGDVRYLRSRRDDPFRALHMMTAPDLTLASTVTPPVSQVSEPTAVTAPAPDQLQPPAVQQQPVQPVQQQPVQQQAPVQQQTPPTAAATPATGAAAAG